MARLTRLSTMFQEHNIFTLTVVDRDTIVIPATDHHFDRHPFVYAFYQVHPSGAILYHPDFRNPYPYGYDDDGNIFFHLATPFTGDIVLTCVTEAWW